MRRSSTLPAAKAAIIGKALDLVLIGSSSLALAAYVSYQGMSLGWLVYYAFCATLIWSIVSSKCGTLLGGLSVSAWAAIYTAVFCSAFLGYAAYYGELKTLLTGTGFLFGQKGDEYFYYQAARAGDQFLEGREYLDGLQGLYAPFQALSRASFDLFGPMGLVPLNALAAFCTGVLISAYVAKGTSPGIGRQCALIWVLNPEVYLWATSLYKETLVAFALAGLLYATTRAGTVKRSMTVAGFGALALAVRASAAVTALSAGFVIVRRRSVLALTVVAAIGALLLVVRPEGIALLELFFNEQRLAVLIGSRVSNVASEGALYGLLLFITIGGAFAEAIQPMLLRLSDTGNFGEINAYLAAPALYWLVLFPYFARGMVTANPLGRRSALIYVALAVVLALSLLIFTGRHRFMLVPYAIVAVGFGVQSSKGKDALDYSVLQVALLCAWAVVAAIRL